MRYSPDGTRFACTRYDGSLRIEILDAPTLTLKTTCPGGHNPRWRTHAALVAESPDGEPDGFDSQGFHIDYVPANRGQLDAASELVAQSDLRTTHVGTLPALGYWAFPDARDPRLSSRIDNICLRHPDSGDLRVVPVAGGPGNGLGPGDDARWSVDGSMLTWAWGGRVYGRLSASGATVDLTPPGRSASAAVPLRDRRTGQYYVGLVLATSGDNGDLWVVPFGAAPTQGWFAASSGGSSFDWDLYSPGNDTIQAIYRTPGGAPKRADVSLSAPMQPITAPAGWPTVPPTNPGHPSIFAWFYSHGRYGDFTPPATATLLALDWYSNDKVVPPDARAKYATALERETAFVSAADLVEGGLRARWQYVRGVFIHEPSTVDQARHEAEQVRQAMRDYKLPMRPVVAIIAANQSLDPAYRQTGCDALAPEIYFDTPARDAAEMRLLADQRVREVLGALAPVPLYLIPQCYDKSSPAWKQQPQQLAQIEAACAAALTRAEVFGLWPFAYARPGGATTYPELAAIYAQQASVMTAPPMPVDPKPPDPDEGEMTEEQVRKNTSVPWPPDIMLEFTRRMRNEVCWERDWVGQDNISGGAMAIYLVPNLAKHVEPELAVHGDPALHEPDPAKVYAIWYGWFSNGLVDAANAYWKEQGKPDRLPQ